MTDPRFTDPRLSDPRLNDPVLRREESVSGTWGWIAGLAVLALVAFVVVAAWNSEKTSTANTGASPPITTGSAPRNVMPPSTTGQGSTSPQPMTPAPSSAPRQ